MAFQNYPNTSDCPHGFYKTCRRLPMAPYTGVQGRSRTSQGRPRTPRPPPQDVPTASKHRRLSNGVLGPPRPSKRVQQPFSGLSRPSQDAQRPLKTFEHFQDPLSASRALALQRLPRALQDLQKMSQDAQTPPPRLANGLQTLAKRCPRVSSVLHGHREKRLQTTVEWAFSKTVPSLPETLSQECRRTFTSHRQGWRGASRYAGGL